MSRRLTIIFVTFLLLMPFAAAAKDDDVPTVGILRYGISRTVGLSDKGFLDMLQAYGIISEAERLILGEGVDLYGENINILWRNAGFDLPTANVMVDDALDHDVDALLTQSTPVTQIAVNATADMDDAPAILFNIVSAPYTSGIASAPCIKPDHVTGTRPTRSFEDYLALTVLQDPDISVIGTLVAPAEQQSVESVDSITAAAETLGLAVETASIAVKSEVPIATEALLDKGVEALVVGLGVPITSSLSAIVNVSLDYGVPVYSAVPGHINRGATIGAGFNQYFEQVVIASRTLIGHPNGTLDIATVSISENLDHTVAVNLDTAEAQGIEISEAVLARAEFWIEDGEISDEATPELPQMTLDERMAADAAFLENLRCTQEMIAEQQAAHAELLSGKVVEE